MREGALLGGVLLGVVLLSLPLLNQPFGRDQGIFATIADVIRQDGLPYRDAWDHKPPGIDYAYALAFHLFGRSWQAVHLLELLGLLAAMVGLWWLVRPAGSRPALLAAALLGAGSVLQFEWWDRGQAEWWIATLATVGIAGLQPGLPWPRAAALVGGGLLGSVVWFKPTAVPLVLIGGALALAGQQRWVRLALVAAGALLAVGVPAGLFWQAGAFGDLWTAVVLFNQLHVQTGANLTLAAAIWATVAFAERMGPLVPLAAAGLTAARRWPSGVLLLLGWLLVALAGVWAQGKFFSYHWSVALPPLAGLAGLGLNAGWEAVCWPGPHAWLRRGIAAVLAGALLLPIWADQQGKLGRDLPYLLGWVSWPQYAAQFGHNLNNVDVYSFRHAQATADYLRAHTAPSEPVLVWGFQALVNWLAERPAPTRYIFSYPLTIERPESPLRWEARQTFLREFDARPPAYVVLVSKDINPIQTRESVALLEEFPEFKARLTRDYRPEQQIGEFLLLRRHP
ncbi:MAG: hypothetical protein K6U89_06240 [Chloroflexi bacterium]|nr:hypothetical protein [Chloroflexota bacterium]